MRLKRCPALSKEEEEEEYANIFLKIPKSRFRISRTVSTFVCAVVHGPEIDRLWMRITGCQAARASFENVPVCSLLCTHVFCTWSCFTTILYVRVNFRS